MNPDQILKRHAEAGGHTLLVDAAVGLHPADENIHLLEMDPLDLWVGDHGVPPVKTAVVSKPRTARDLYRVLANLERLVVPGGSILIAPYATEAGPENRFEATEVFLGVHPGWERNLVNGSTVELKKATAAVSVTKTPPQLHIRGELAIKTPATKRVVSLAVFGERRYWRYLGCYIRAHHALFPAYELRIHHDEGIDNVPYGRALKTMAARGVINLRQMPSRPGMGKCEKMAWRLAPAWDTDVEYVIARDLDAGTSWRDRCAVEEFIASGLDAHALYDNPAHIGLMGGMCSYRAAKLREIFGYSYADFIATANYSDERWAEHGADQDFMNSRIWPVTKIFEQRVFEQLDEKRPPSPGITKYVDRIADPGPLDVPVAARFKSDTLIAYLGVAGYELEPAIEFYSSREEDGMPICPVIDQIESAEADAGVTADGSKPE